LGFRSPAIQRRGIAKTEAKGTWPIGQQREKQKTHTTSEHAPARQEGEKKRKGENEMRSNLRLYCNDRAEDARNHPLSNVKAEKETRKRKGSGCRKA
jgi:hypothetical protein